MQNGNQSANSAYQTWRQFSGSPLKKKETSKANLIDIESKFITPSQKDWVGELYKTGSALLKTKAQIDEGSDKEAQRIFGSRSLEQFTKEYQEGKLPSQNNPLVMSRLKYMYGQNIAGLAHTDFLNRISSNEFHDKTPEEVDKLYYEHMNETYNSYRELFDFTKGDDSYYNNGFWDGGYKGRVLVQQAQQETKHKFTKDLASTTELSNIAGIASTSDNPYEGINALNMGIEMGSLSTPKDMVKGVETFAEALTVSPHAFDKDGNFRLEQVKDVKIKTLNKTVGEVLGHKMTTLKLKALENQATQNFDGISKLTGEISQLVANAKVEELQSMLDEELKASKGFKTPRANLLESGRNQAIKKREALNSRIAGSIEDKERMSKAIAILADPNTGKISPNTVTGINKEAWDNAFNVLLNQWGSDSEKLNWALSVAERASDIPNNPAVTWLGSYFREAFASIERDVNNFNANPTLVSDNWNPRAQHLFGAYSMNPNVLDSIVAKDYHGNSNRLQVLAHLYASGVPYRDVLRGISLYNTLNTEDKQKLNLKVAQEVKNLQIEDETYGRSDDPYSISVVRGYALAYKQLNPDADTATVMNEAVDMFKKNNENFKGAYIPKSFFNVLGADTDPNFIQNFGREALESLVKNDKKIPKDAEVRYMYIPHLNSVAVMSLDNRIYTAITKKDMKGYYETHKEAYANKIKEKQDILLKKASNYKTTRSFFETNINLGSGESDGIN